MCSLIRNDLSSFHGALIQLEENLHKRFYLDNAILLAADCSIDPKLAIFVTFQSDNQTYDMLKVFIGHHEILINSNYMTNEGAYIEVNQNRVYVTPGNAYTYPNDDKVFEYK